MYSSAEEVSKLLIAYQDKRDYVLSNEKISDTGIRRMVKFCDTIIAESELIYDSIISDKAIRQKHISPHLNNIEEALNNIKEVLHICQENIRTRRYRTWK